MNRPASPNNGFTLIELLAVLLIIVILLAIAGFGYKGVEARNRNRERTKAVDAIHSLLEQYYQTATHYPSLKDINNSTWLATNFKGLDTSTFEDPLATTTSFATNPKLKQYAYQPRTASGASCEDNDALCTTYTLTATLEGGGTYSRQNTD